MTLEPSTIPTNQSLSPLTHGIRYNISIPESRLRVCKKKNPPLKRAGTSNLPNLELYPKHSFTHYLSSLLRANTRDDKGVNGRSPYRCGCSTSLHRLSSRMTPGTPSGRRGRIGGPVCETQASGTWCQGPGTRDHLHVTGKETEPDLLRPASCDPRL